MACIIEFTGKPGSGKTHYCRELVRCTGEESIHDRVKVMLFSGQRKFKYPLKIISCFECLVASRARALKIVKIINNALSGVNKRRLVSTIVNAAYIDFNLRRALRDHDIVILDQGFVQLCWANIHDKNIEEVKSVLQTLYEPYADHDVLISYIHASGEVFEANVATRPDLLDKCNYQVDSFDEARFLGLVGDACMTNRLDLIRLHNNNYGSADVGRVFSRIEAACCASQ
ncbi:hypothetical protein DFP85_10199 [Halomonas ventosae]|uniref:Thymidylate kinase n=1 Tax=Halomonas ventosae TaxID=229007 RepID=A0A4R6ZY34_9GAMM|nr:hypothetical protein [Halomonas ventosae]TDR57284.1 hypothetical protein DFP85_10199 [Halomonas ventosae]